MGVLAVAVLGVATAWVLQPRSWLVIRAADRPGAPIRAVYPGRAGTHFALRWMHSVEREDWIECFRVVHGHVEIAATRFKTFGAGVPAHAGRQTRLEHGWVVMSGIDRDVDPLTVQAAAAEHYRFRYEQGAWQALSKTHEKPILSFTLHRASWAAMGPMRLATLWRGVRK